MLGHSSIFLFNYFLHVFCNSTKTSANSSDIQCVNMFVTNGTCYKISQVINTIIIIIIKRGIRPRGPFGDPTLPGWSRDGGRH